MSVPELVGGLPPPCRMAIPRVFFIVRHNADNQRTTTPLDFLNNKKDCKNLQNNIEDSERREQKQMKTEISDLVMPSRILSYLKILKVEGNAKSSLNLHLLVSAKRGFGLLCVIRCRRWSQPRGGCCCVTHGLGRGQQANKGIGLVEAAHSVE